MGTPKLTCDNCEREYPIGYMLKRMEMGGGPVYDLCVWCAADQQPPAALALERLMQQEEERNFERGLPGMREQDYE